MLGRDDIILGLRLKHRIVESQRNGLRELDKNKTITYQVTLPYACFGIEVQGQTVVSAAPIGRWMVGKSLVVVGEWIARKHGVLKQIEEQNEQHS